MLTPKWFATWAAVKTPTPASVAWHRESCPAIPVIIVMDRSTMAYARPLLKTPVHASGIQVSMDTKNPAKTTHHKTRMIRSMLGTRAAAAMGGGGGSIVAIGSRLASSSLSFGSNSRAPTRKMKGRDGMIAA